MKSIVRVMAGAATLGSALLWGAAPAGAYVYEEYRFDENVTSIKASAQKQVPTRSSTVTVTITFTPPEGAYTFDDPQAYVSSDIGYSGASVDLVEVSPGVLKGTTQISNSAQPGKWWVDYDIWIDLDPDVYYYDWDYAYADFQKSFYVKRNAVMAFDATPEPAKIGTKQMLKGTIKGLKGTWSVAYGGLAQQVKFYFDPAGSDPKRYMGATVANSKGEFAKAFTVKRSGTWSAAYAGSSIYVPVAMSDYVTATR